MKISMLAFVLLVPFAAFADGTCLSNHEGCEQPEDPCQRSTAGVCDMPPASQPAPQPIPKPTAQAPTPASYLYLAWLEWRKQRRQPLSGTRIREIGGRGLIGWNEGGDYYDDYDGETYYRDPYLGVVGGSLYVRAYRLDTGLGVEASWDFINYHGLEELRQVALMKYLPIDQRTKAYVLVGGGLTTYDPGYSAQAGGGLEFSLTRRLSVHADLRLSYVTSNVDDYCGYQPGCGGGENTLPERSETKNAVLNVGGGWKFVSVFERMKKTAPSTKAAGAGAF